MDSPFNWEDAFGDTLHYLEVSDRDLFVLFNRDKEKNLLPQLYQSCGTEDFLFEMNREAHRRFTAMGAEISYHEVEGHMHNWDFWDMEIRNIFKWLFGN